MHDFKKIRNKSKQSQKALKGKSENLHDDILKPVLFSLKDFDTTQGQYFTDWHECELLVGMLERIKCLSSMTVKEAERGKSFTIYPCFSPNTKVFVYPIGVTDDARWASFHIQGKERIIGHIVKNIFYIVFLDKDHEFWPCELKNT